MLSILDEFRNKLDDIMLQAMHSSVLLYGYESYTGRFIKWYAEYYHNIKMDYIVSTDMSRGRAYDMEIFRPSVIDFNYKNVRQAVIWVVEPVTGELKASLEEKGYIDRCHCIPGPNDAIFDYGCGKGGALVSFLDYGFMQVGGIEYEPKIYDVLKENMRRLGLENETELLYGDAGELTEQLDKYNWFYFFLPFDDYIFKKCIKAICDSYRRNKRKIHIISISPYSYESIENTGVFRLTNQFTVDMRQRVVDVFESNDRG